MWTARQGSRCRQGHPCHQTPGAFDEEVADVAYGYIVMLLRQLHVIHEGVRDGGWPKPPGHSLGGLRLGVIGLGGIGRAVVRRGVVAQMDVVGSDPMPESRAAAETDGCTIMEIDELMATSHVVSVNAPLNDSTRHLVNAERLQSMPAGGYLVNTGRGEVVDTAALAAVAPGTSPAPPSTFWKRSRRAPTTRFAVSTP